MRHPAWAQTLNTQTEGIRLRAARSMICARWNHGRTTIAWPALCSTSFANILETSTESRIGNEWTVTPSTEPAVSNSLIRARVTGPNAPVSPGGAITATRTNSFHKAHPGNSAHLVSGSRGSTSSGRNSKYCVSITVQRPWNLTTMALGATLRVIGNPSTECRQCY